jgi:nucleoside phosphorylase
LSAVTPNYARHSGTAPDDEYAITYAGLLRCSRSDEIRGAILGLLSFLRRKFSEDPDFRGFNSRELALEAFGPRDPTENLHFCLTVIRAAGIAQVAGWGSGQPMIYTWRVPKDIEILVTLRTLAEFEQHQEETSRKFETLVQYREIANPKPSGPDTGTASDEPRSTERIGLADAIDVAILTAIEVERRAVCAVFGLTDEHRAKRGSRVYWRGRLLLKGGSAYEIVVAQPGDIGQVEAALLANDVIQHWTPAAAVLVGIAAAAAKDVKLGDVVVARSVYYFEHGKVTPNGVRPQPEMIPADPDLLNHVVAVPSWAGAVGAERPDGGNHGSTLHVGVIASGEKVIAHAAIRDQIAAGHRKILAMEMEGYGFSLAFWQKRVRQLVIRGMCDDGSSAKNDDWHKYAAIVAARFAEHLLLDRPLPLRDRTSRPF